MLERKRYGIYEHDRAKNELVQLNFQAYAGFESKAKQALEERIRLNNLTHLFGEVHVPQETVVELVKGQKKTSTRKFFPGYILVQMVMNEETWHLVKETPKISGFLWVTRRVQFRCCQRKRFSECSSR